MLQDKIHALVLSSLPKTATEGQLRTTRKLTEFLIAGEEREIFLLKGYAGTGKTTLISAIINALKQLSVDTILLAPTGRAAKVLSGYSKKEASTIHKKIFRQKKGSDGLGEFALSHNPHAHTIFIVDEAGMIGNEAGLSLGADSLLSSLFSYVYNGSGCKLLLCGDTAQLPPVGCQHSPALDPKTLSNMGFHIKESFLSDIVRQSQQAEILNNATMLRKMIASGKAAIPTFITGGEVECVQGSELIETITESYEKKGSKETIIINRSNKRANQYNMGIRNQILWREDELSMDDQLMIVKNNYFWTPGEADIAFIANGDTGRITRIKKHQHMYGFHFADITLALTDYQSIEIETKVILDTLHAESPSLSMKQNQLLFNAVMEDHQDEKTKKAQYKKVKEDPYFNALQIKFAYAVTCHKSQGGQWKDVFIDLGYITEEMIDIAFLRWLYTAFTRATEKVYLVNFPRMFLNTPAETTL